MFATRAGKRGTKHGVCMAKMKCEYVQSLGERVFRAKKPVCSLRNPQKHSHTLNVC